MGKVGTYFEGIHGMRKLWVWGWSNLTYQNERNTNLTCWIVSLHKIRKSSNHVQYPSFEEIYVKNMELGRRTSKKIGNQILFYEASFETFKSNI